MRVVVVGAGAWGRPAGAELAARGHDVVVLDAHGVGNRVSSSSGATRLWRLAHPDAARVRLALRSVAAWRRLEGATGTELLLTRGLLWRDAGSVPAVADALASESVEHVAVDPGDVDRFFPGLRPNGIAAVWQPEAGPVLASAALSAAARRLAGAGGRLETARVVGIDTTGAHPVTVTTDHAQVLAADRVVLAPGPWAPALLDLLGIDLPLAPVLEQVCYLGGTADEDLPCWFEGPRDGEPGLYAMPTPGRGYKVGIDQPLRAFDPGDPAREASPRAADAIAARVARDLPTVAADVTGCDVCSWTYSPDGRFVVDTVEDERVVLACGDSGEGFKFSALLGEVLADLAEGVRADPDVAGWSLARFGGAPPMPERLPTLGV